MKKEIKNVTILKNTVRRKKDKMLKRLGFAPRSQSFAFVALPQYAQSVRYPDSLPLRPSANPQVQDDMVRVQRDMCGVQHDMVVSRHCERMRSNPANYFARSAEKNFSLFTSHFSQNCVFTSHLSRKSAFTLAEVLITLGIIGVVAAVTLPTLIAKHQQNVAETRIKEFYSIINQAVVRAEVDYGDKRYWAFGDGYCSSGPYSEQCIKQNFERYFKPYLKILDYEFMSVTDIGNTGLLVNFSNGSSAIMTYMCKDILFYPVGSLVKKSKNNKKNIEGKDYFLFGFYASGASGNRNIYFKNKGVEPYVYSTWNGNEKDLPCLKRIQMNGWKFPDDCNPYK